MKIYTIDNLIMQPRQELISIIAEHMDSIKQLQSTIAAQQKEIDTLTNDAKAISIQNDWLRRQVFGAKSERFIPSDDLQIALELEVISKDELEENDTESDKTISFTYKKKDTSNKIKGHGRGEIPTHLPIIDVLVLPEADTTGMECIGKEVSWHFELDTPSQLKVIRTTRPKFIRKSDNTVLIGKLTELPIDKGNAGPALQATIVINKFQFSIPLDRQRKMFELDYNVKFSRSWLSDLVKNTAFWLKPVLEDHKAFLLSSTYLQADETPIPVIIKKNKSGKTVKGYLWVYYDPIQKITVIDYQNNRSSIGPSQFLKDFKGTLQIDGYEGYSEIIKKNNITRAGCMDHVRRRFEKALKYDVKRARHVLDTLRVWYNVEQYARDNNLSPEARLAQRIEKVVPSMAALKKWMDAELLKSDVIPKSPIGIALSYTINQWEYFNAYMTDGRIELSNILVENQIRPVAIGRKNFMFAGSEDAATWLAIIYSLIATAKMHGHKPLSYFKELLTELPKESCTTTKQFLLTTWKPALTETASESTKTVASKAA